MQGVSHVHMCYKVEKVQSGRFRCMALASVAITSLLICPRLLPLKLLSLSTVTLDKSAHPLDNMPIARQHGAYHQMTALMDLDLELELVSSKAARFIGCND